MDLLLASNNKKKLIELQSILARPDVTLVTPRDLKLELVPEENGSSFIENARIKALAMCKATGLVTIADDSGLMVQALGGAPGVHSARYAGEGATDDMLWKKLLREMKDVPPEERGARFVSVVCLVYPDGRPEVVGVGECAGFITEEPAGKGGFGYDPVFYYPPMNKTFAEMTEEEKNSISHRGAAIRALLEKL